MNAETLEMTLIESATVDDHSTMQLVEMLGNKYTLAAVIYVILDNAKYHYLRKVRKF